MKPIKIKTITCHEVYNYGASLQEYALLEFLNQEGFDASVIHYKPWYLSGHFKMWTVSNPKYNKPIIKQLYLLAKLPGRLKALKRKEAFDNFHKKYIPTDKKLYRTNQELKDDLPEGDVFICGSDQIWNSFFENGKDPAFYLNFVPDDKLKISYAASFATDKIIDEVKSLVKENVERIHTVSVRETSGLSILKDLGIIHAIQVLDPVFLLTPKHWKENFVHKIKENYIFVYDSDSNPLIKEIALQLQEDKGYKIFTVDKNINYADRNYYYHGPEMFLSLLYYSKYTLTNSFHATAYSIIFKRQFIVFNRFEKINTRMRDLLGLFNLSNYLIDNINDFNNLTAISYYKIENKIQQEIEKSKAFLKNNIKYHGKRNFL